MGNVVKLAPTGSFGGGSAHLFSSTFHSCLSLPPPPTHPRDQREEELGEYYMKKYAKSSVGET